MPTLLHISDLHRTPGPRLSNDDLLAAIRSDAARWESEGLDRPDIIVVSGDVIQGHDHDAADPDSDVRSQYAEAGSFLGQLAEEFVGSDRSRVVIVPGNHDVHWSRSRLAMEQLQECPAEIATKSLEPASQLRWSWEDQTAFKITDLTAYDSRLDHFRQFREEFYRDANPNPLKFDHDLFFVEYPDLKMVAAGFPSWHGNDCFCLAGDIAPSALVLAQQLMADSPHPIALATWHHSIIGGPRTHDYMDQRIVHRLVDFGFNLGLHGHQHFPDAAPFELRLPNLTSMGVIGAGSLAVGDDQLPMGEQRQFNVITIDPDKETVKVHVRAMSHAGVFAGSHRNDFGGNTYMQIQLPRPPRRHQSTSRVQMIDNAITAVRAERFDDALKAIEEIDPSCSAEVRAITIAAFEGLGKLTELMEFLDPPKSTDEATKLISLLLDVHRFGDASDVIQVSEDLLGEHVAKELDAAINARRRLYESS
ncbi:MAG: metallophosphoesterase [Gammaproteobacteria bacterium]|nr:metallophosphoesterase [Gammaproteobacteria bacterium]